MKNIQNFLFLVSYITVNLFFGFNSLIAQEKAVPGVQYVIVNFASAPTTATVTKTVLRYNKDFAFSFHTDDGFADVYTVGFPFFTGINTSGTNYPGLFYTDGCGNDISFKLSNSIFSFSGFNNEDMHQPGNGYGTVSWPQLSVMYQNGCSVNNHGFTSDAFTEPDYMSYSIRRNESFIRRRLLEATPGGVKTRLFVNPNGATPYTDVAFTEGYRSTLRMGATGIIPNNGLDIGTLSSWTQPLELNRNLAESVNVKQLVDQYAAAAANGQHFWMPIFTHRIVEDYPQASFISDFNYIATTYGKNGSDKIWMATEEEIIDYQIVRQLTTINYAVTGTTLLITFSGDIPTDLRYYALSLKVDADAPVAGISIIGGTNNTYNGLGENSALINLSWNGSVLDDLFELAETNVAYAEQNPTEYNGLIAMDYVLMLPIGAEREALKARLCALPGIEYEQGFCLSCEVDLGPDLSICAGSCTLIQAPEVLGNTYLWSTGETTPSILYCPMNTDDVYVTVTTAEGCEASDTLAVNLLPSLVFSLGDDIGSCPGDTLLITAPDDPSYAYAWYLNSIQLPETGFQIEIAVADTSLLKLLITNANGCISSDSISINVWEQPLVQVLPDIADLCLGQSLTLTAEAQFADSFQWWNGSDQTTTLFNPTETGIFSCWFKATNGFGCTSTDTSFVTVHALPDFTLSLVDGATPICAGSEAGIQVDIDAGADVVLLVWNETETIPTNGQTTITRIFSFTETTVVTVKAISSIGCETEKTISVTVLPLPSITISQAAQTCVGGSVILEASGGVSCKWYLNNQLISNNYTLEYTPLATSFFKAVVTGAGPGFCSTSDSVLVTVYPLPSVTIQASFTEVCKGTSVILTASGAATYVWTTNESTAQIIVQPDATSSFGVQGTTTQGCVGLAEVSIDVLPVPDVTLTGLLPVYCQTDASTPIIATPDGGFFSGIEIVDQMFDPSVTGPGNHTLYYQVTSVEGCVGIDSLSTVVRAFDKTIDLGPDTLICPHESVLFDAGEGFETYYWSTGHSSRQIEIQGTTYLPGTTRTITVVGVLDGCTAGDDVLLTIRSDCYIGLEEKVFGNEISIVPNPNKGTFEIHSKTKLSHPNLLLSDLSGKTIWQTTTDFDSVTSFVYPISLTDIQPGFYILTVTFGQKQYVNKVVIE